MKARIFSIKNQGVGSFQGKKFIVFKGIKLTMARLAHFETMEFFSWKTSHAMILYRKNSGFHYLKDENFAFISALGSLKNSSSFRSYIEKNPKLP